MSLARIRQISDARRHSKCARLAYIIDAAPPMASFSDDATQEFLRTYMTEMRAFIVRVFTVLPRNA